MDFRINKIYNFNTLASNILGGAYSEMCVKAMLSAQEAIKYRDITTLHESMINEIPGIPTNPSDCTFILFESKDCESVVLAIEYIDLKTVAEASTLNIRIELPNLTISDNNIIRGVLLELGYSDFNITTY